jgi:aminomethyltransferase
MPIPSPFHERTLALCGSMHWKEWAGFYSVCSYDTSHEMEYFAFRNAAGLIDVTPLFKYDVSGPDAQALLTKVMAKNISKLKLGQVTYCCWCDDQGKVIDDGTVTRLEENIFRVTAADPSFTWIERYARGFDVKIEDITEKIGALSLQGPNSREILKQCCDADMDKLKFFYSVKTKFKDFPAIITRTGYTGDLGFEIWVDNAHAVKLWDVLMAEGQAYGLAPCGLDAMDVTRIEAGFILAGVDYHSARHAMIESHKSTPYEIGLGWTVNLKRDAFNGQAALKAEKKSGSKLQMVGLSLDWDELEAMYKEHDLPPGICSAPWRSAVPVYDHANRYIGRATSGTWSPILKKNLALATVDAEFAKEGTELQMECTVEYERRTITAVVSKTPFFNPERKRT